LGAATFDFSGTSAIGKRATFEVSVAGGGDAERGTWAYVDGRPGVPASVAASGHDDPQSGVTVITADGETSFLIDQRNQYQRSCARPRLTMTIPGVTGAPHVLFVEDNGTTKAFDTQQAGSEFTAREDFLCVQGSGQLFVTYDDGTSHVVPVARVASFDRAGRIYDRVKFDQLMNLPHADAAGARAGAAIGGASVRLQQRVNGQWEPMVASASGLDPALNPETTNGDGHYQWSVPAGHYRVVASAPGYADARTPEFDGPTTLRDMDVAMEPLNQPPPPEQGPPLIIIDPELLRLPPVPQAPPPTDRAFAGVGFATRIPVDRKGVATFNLRCPAGERACKGEIRGKTAVTLPRDASRRERQSTGRQLSLRPIAFRIDGPGQARLRAKLSRKVFGRLRRQSRLPVDLSIDAQDGAGNLTTTKAEVTFTYGKKRNARAGGTSRPR
jgi:Carboxypeptidase regulatory-like domain